MWDDELDPVTLSNLELAYMRRAKWEAHIQAVEIVNVLGEALGGSGKKAVRETTSDGLLQKMGVKWA